MRNCIIIFKESIPRNLHKGVNLAQCFLAKVQGHLNHMNGNRRLLNENTVNTLIQEAFVKPTNKAYARS